MEDAEFLNILKQQNSTLDTYLLRVEALERNNPSVVSYYQQMYKTLNKPECCVAPVVIPKTAQCCLGTGTCQPNELSFIPSVVVTDLDTEVLMHYELSIDGAVTSNTIVLPANAYSDKLNNAARLAELLFLYSGVDLMRQQDMRNYFEYSPYDDLTSLSPIVITGYTSDVANPNPYNFEIEPHTIILTLKTIPVLGFNQLDYVAEQWGTNQVLRSCSSFINIGV